MEISRFNLKISNFDVIDLKLPEYYALEIIKWFSEVLNNHSRVLSTANFLQHITFYSHGTNKNIDLNNVITITCFICI